MDFQVEEHGGVNIQAEDNAPMEEDDPIVDHTIEDYSIRVVDKVREDMIEQDGIGVANQDDNDDGTSMFDNDDEDGSNIPILEKAYETLYQGSQTTLLTTIVLMVNLKVMNGLFNVEMSCMLRYVIFVIFNVSIPLLFIILKNHVLV